MRFDKRSAGKSTGDYSVATLEDFARDALAGVEYLKTRKEIDSQQIGFVGFSEGGMTGVLAASKSNDIAFMVLMAAPCVNAEEIVHAQEASLQRAAGVSEEMIVQTAAFREEVIKLLKAEKDQGTANQKLRKFFAERAPLLTPYQKQAFEMSYGPLEAQVEFFSSSWVRYWLTYDPTLALKQIKAPILALNGDLDFVVSPKQNLEKIDHVLKAVGHKDYTTAVLPKLNHMFQTCQTGSMAECANIEETMSPLALRKMAEWILERTSKQKY